MRPEIRQPDIGPDPSGCLSGGLRLAMVNQRRAGGLLPAHRETRLCTAERRGGTGAAGGGMGTGTGTGRGWGCFSERLSPRQPPRLYPSGPAPLSTLRAKPFKFRKNEFIFMQIRFLGEAISVCEVPRRRPARRARADKAPPAAGPRGGRGGWVAAAPRREVGGAALPPRYSGNKFPLIMTSQGRDKEREERGNLTAGFTVTFTVPEGKLPAGL